MDFSDRLNLLIDEYLNEVNKKNISRISISVPNHTGHFWIADSYFHLLNTNSEFSLAIFFSLNYNDKEGKRILKKVNDSKFLVDFTQQNNGTKTVGYIKDIGINKDKLVEAVLKIVKELFPKVIPDDILLTLVKTEWHTLGKS